MGCDSLAFTVTLVNGLENQYIDRRSVNRLVLKPPNSPKKTRRKHANVKYGTAGGGFA